MTRDEFAVAMLRGRLALTGDIPPGRPVATPIEPKVTRPIQPKERYTAQERETLLLKLAPDFYALVPKDHWAYAAMRELQAVGFWSQFGFSTSFDGRLELKRSAFATMLHLVGNIRATLAPEVQELLDKLRNEFRSELASLDQVTEKREEQPEIGIR